MTHPRRKTALRLAIPLLVSSLPVSSRADVPQVVTDIAPIHSLVAQVMDGLGVPDVLVSGAASPHDFQFTFAQAAALQDADLVIWAGPNLTPWLSDSVDNLAGDSAQLALLQTQGWPKLSARDWDDGHDHDGHGEEDHSDHEEDEHSDHSEDAHSDHDEDAHTDHHDEEVNTDPHAWLDPVVATAWVQHIGEVLTQLDPANAPTYASNVAATIERLDALQSDIATRMTTLPNAAFLVPHDAYQYFGARFDRLASGAISPNDGQTPSPATIVELRDMMRDLDVTCVLSDPQTRSEWGDLIREGTTARTAVADPMGGMFEPGPDHYRQMMLSLSQAYADCIGG